MSEFRVSVIIPVYNAADYVRKAVESALVPPAVGEIILVEDASPDNALEICEELTREYPKVKLFRHPNGANKGAGASRNLGVEKATCAFIAFLDADDYIYPYRFDRAEQMFREDPTIDAVYERVDQFTEEFVPDPTLRVYYYPDKIAPADLLKVTVKGGRGHSHTDGITVKREFVLRCGGFDEDLRLHQDTFLWWKFMLHGKLLPGVMDKPVALYRKHPGNRITGKNARSVLPLYEKACAYFLNPQKVDDEVKNIFLKRRASALVEVRHSKQNPILKKLLKAAHYLRLKAQYR